MCIRDSVNIVMFSGFQSLSYFCYQFLTKANNDKPFKSSAYKKRSKTSTDTKILMNIDRLGLTQANRFIAHFGSVKAVLQASEEQLMSMEGVGTKTAIKIRAFSKIFY